jgi:hypothetical protein
LRRCSPTSLLETSTAYDAWSAIAPEATAGANVTLPSYTGRNLACTAAPAPCLTCLLADVNAHQLHGSVSLLVQPDTP